MRRYLILSFALCHLLTAVLYNVVSCADHLRAVYGVADENGPAAPAWQALRLLAGARPVRAYGHYSGTGAGYGFFAPRVGSVYYLRMAVYDRAGHLLKTVFDPGLTQAASRLRYTSFLHTFQSLLPEPDRLPGTTPLQQRTARVIARSISQQYARRSAIPYIARIRFDVLVHYHPPLRKETPRRGSVLVNLYGQDITFAEPS